MKPENMIGMAALGYVVGGLVGAYVGYVMGAEAIQYAHSLANPDLLSYLAIQNPWMTELVATEIGMGAVGGAGALGLSILGAAIP